MSRRAAAGLLAALLLAGCTGGGRSGGAATPAPSTRDTTTAAAAAPGVGLNGTDVTFLRMLLPHHRQGVELARLGHAKASREELVLLAAAIEATQADEAELMAAILAESGEPETAPVTPAEDDPHAAHGGLPSTSERQVAALRAATGTEFERRFLATMMAHQGDAIRLAKMEIASGADKRLVDLAGRIERLRTGRARRLGRAGARRPAAADPRRGGRAGAAAPVRPGLDRAVPARSGRGVRGRRDAARGRAAAPGRPPLRSRNRLFQYLY